MLCVLKYKNMSPDNKTMAFQRAGKPAFLGIFFVSLATLIYEILLTRIFSVTMWFHFAFVAVSIAMFGMTVGAILVYLYPRYFPEHKLLQRLTQASMMFGVTVLLSFLAHLHIPFVTDVSFKNLFFIGLTYSVISVPFIFSGICICLILTRYPKDVGRLYAADLAGAAIGCVLLIVVLSVTDASSAVFFTATLASLAGVFFASSDRGAFFKRAVAVAAILAVAYFAHASISAFTGSPIFRLKLIKGSVESKPLYEKWNSFSRVTVTEDPNGPAAFGWGLSSVHANDLAPKELWLRMDSGAATPITEFSGDLSQHQYLKYDITNMVHYIRPDANVLVVGIGGGRDILSALVFDQRSVTGVEINQAIIDTVNGPMFGDFSGHLDLNPKVRMINDEARSFVARSREKFDIIQVSFIDTTAATAAGAFVFTENSLYTTEAWKAFVQHLTPDGILSFSRWYYLDLSGEIYRMISIADNVLRSMGFEDPRKHLVCVRNIREEGIGEVGTLMLSLSPFTAEQLAELDRLSGEFNFEVMLSPLVSKDPVFDKLLGEGDKEEFLNKFPINIAAPTDDNPFFFSMVRPWDVLKESITGYKLATFNVKAIFVLAALLLIVTVLTLLCILVPLLMTAEKSSLRGTLPLLFYFAMIGLGFMFIEISQMQRLSIFLGHPVYGLSVVLFTLLLASGVGSFMVGSGSVDTVDHQGKTRLFVLIGTLILIGLFTPSLVRKFEVCGTPVRIMISMLVLTPMGITMGMAFPLGMRLAGKYSSSLTPWLWGINGATSVYASVLAVIVAISFGVSASYWTGLVCYFGAFVAFLVAMYGIRRQS